MSEHRLEEVEENNSFNCKICHISFSLQGHLERHITTAHEKKKAFNYIMVEENTCLKNNVHMLIHDNT